MNNSRQYVESFAMLWELNNNKQPEQAQLWEYLLEHGREFDHVDIEASKAIRLRQGFKNRECHFNAMIMALIDPKNCRMWQGIGARHIPTVHSWLVDVSGNVIDPTWCDDIENPADYFGIEIPLEITKKYQRKYKRSAWLVPAVAIGEHALKLC